MKGYDFDCPIEAALAVIGGKWKASIIYYLIDRELRFTELLNLLETASTRMLSKQLQELEHDGILERKVFAEVPPRVQYALTEYGKTLIPMIQSICAWGEDRLEKIGKKSVYN
jgi:DNA-binding HxlR family transcriptional regulator